MAESLPRSPGPLDIPRPLLAKYATSGPRYTSYPTAPQFKADFDEPGILAAWRETNRDLRRGISIYLHVPFCRSRCLYCGCFTEIGHGPDMTERYVAAMLREAGRISDIIDPSRPAEQLAVGGGTPTFLRPGQMRTLMEGLAARFTFSAKAERSIEVDPRSVDTAYLDLLLALGFNRISFGVQDLDKQVQRNVSRVLHEQSLVDLIEHLRRQGFHAINLDLMYGLPGQTEASFRRTVDRIIEIRPSRIALFGYAHVPWVSPHQRALEPLGLPDPEERTRLFGQAYGQLLEAGYRHVGMDHFAQSDDELIGAIENRTLTRNFMGYTTRRGLDLVGVGVSSISSVDGTYTQNEKNLGAYIKKAGGSTWIRGLRLSPEDLLRREIILDLFCNFFLDIAALERRFGLDFKTHFAGELEQLVPMEADGLLHVDSASIRVTDLGRFFIRNICMCFDQYLIGETRQSAYSRTV
jgi:oxygen-independent coproporphyrinogen-3 oxidase